MAGTAPDGLRDVPGDPSRIAGRYVVEATLGKGGMGAVYRVRDDTTGRAIALKRMTWTGEDVEAARLRFRREFHTMASLRHPRIVEVFDYGVVDGSPYYTLELLDGQDLHDLDRVPWRRACALLRDVASALAFLHARRLLHRDLAPRNVRCTSDGHAKLIDFGVLATAGVVGDIAGTPPFMAPETVYGRPLDHRYDLYGLGALAYRVLTGRHAYPARTIEQLETAWRNKPPPPSAIASDVPAALDELVAALMAADPLARPASAAEVIDRLGAIADLPPPVEVEVASGWIASAALVGRQREVAQIKRAAARAAGGAGRSLLVEAPSGTGKSRLLRELALEAQLAGMTVIATTSEAAGRGPYGVLQALARELVATVPDDALAAARPRAATLARVVAPLRERLGVRPARPLGDPAEDRAQVQEALAGWVLELAQLRPIALLVDDVQRCDEASAAVLAALAHRAGDRKLLVAAALRTDEETRAPGAVASLVDAGRRLRLRGLGEDEVGELCRSLFGDVPHVARLAHWMHRVAGGSPLYTTELARHLVDRGVIRYIDGLWNIPEDAGREDLPRGLAEAMDARVRALPADARALGEVLSVHGGELTLDAIVALADTREPDRVFAALDQLAFEEVLVQAASTWRFRHDGLREALLRGLPAGRGRELHLRVGAALAAAAGELGAERDAEIGWHLLEGGDTTGGAARLERAGRALYAAQSFADCIRPLEAALGVIEQRRGSARVRLELRHTLLMAGAMADRNTALRHADACVDGYRYWAGIDVAVRAKRFVGRHLGVLIGLAWAAMRWIATPRRGPNPYEAFRTFFIVVGYTAMVHSLGFDIRRTKAMVELVEPIALLRRRIPWAVYLTVCNTYHFPRGELATTRANAVRILEILARDRLTPIRDIDRKTGGGGASYMLALSATLDADPAFETHLADLGKLGLTFFDVGAQQARAIFHRLRGEEEAAVAIEGQTELLFVQLGSLWQLEVMIPVISSLAYAHARDMLGLRRTIEQLARRCADGFRYEGFLDLARAEYLRERGDAKAALALLEPLAALEPYPMLGIPVLAALAEVHLVLGDATRGKALAEQSLALATAPETHNVFFRVRALRTLALAQTALGDAAGAADLLDRELASLAAIDHPLLVGSLHEARARIALASNDGLAYQQHRAAAEREFRRTRNPVLIARAQRLEEAGERRAARAPTAVEEPRTQRARPPEADVATEALTTPPPRLTREWISAVLSSCRGESERAARVLQLVVEEARAASGYLYLRKAGQLALVAPAWGDEPAPGLTDALDRALAGEEIVTELHRRGEAEPLVWKAIGLHLVRPDGERVAIGGVAAVAGALPLVDPDPELLDGLARELFEAGDVTHTRMRPPTEQDA